MANFNFSLLMNDLKVQYNEPMIESTDILWSPINNQLDIYPIPIYDKSSQIIGTSGYPYIYNNHQQDFIFPIGT